MKYIGIFTCAVFLFYACKKNETFADYDPTPYELSLVNSTLPPAQIPADNKLTQATVELGRMLFYENDLSRDGSINCASCHAQSTGFSDPSQFSVGVDGSVGGRQSMAIINMAWNSNNFFWDGRADLLRDQALKPIQDHLEMDETLPNVIAKLNTSENYKRQFIRAFGDEKITPKRMALALEQFMHSLVSDDSKYDRYLEGKVTLTDSEERGRALFFTEYNEFFPESSGADCAHCHSLNNFENDLYMNNGLDSDAEFTDFGREIVTSDPEDRAKFKVTTLRNISVTAPYMHDGRFATLEEVIDHYNEGIKTSSTVDGALLGTQATGLMLDSEEKEDLINFLKTLTDYNFLNNPKFKSPF